jgi:uncharacterized protein
MTPLMTVVKASGFRYTGRLLHLFEGGSALHGARVEATSDSDLYGIYIEPPAKALGLDADSHFVWSSSTTAQRNDAGDIDITLYSVRKWAGLACKGNPTALQFLFAPNALIQESTWSALQWGIFAGPVKKSILAKSSARAFKGFVDAQMGRLLGTRGQGKHGQRPELTDNFGYDVKAGMHAMRLMHECIELMRRHEITYPRPERDILMDIRQGKWSLDKLSSEVNRLFLDLALAEQDSTLPAQPDREEVSDFLVAAYMRAYGWRDEDEDEDDED